MDKTIYWENWGQYNEHFFRNLRGGQNSWKSHCKVTSGALKGGNEIWESGEMARPYFYYENIVYHQPDYKGDNLQEDPSTLLPITITHDL